MKTKLSSKEKLNRIRFLRAERRKVNQDMISELIDVLHDQHEVTQDTPYAISKRCDAAPQTVDNLLSGVTVTPYLQTVMRVAGGMGVQVIIHSNGSITVKAGKERLKLQNSSPKAGRKSA